METDYLSSVKKQFEHYKLLGEKTMEPVVGVIIHTERTIGGL